MLPHGIPPALEGQVAEQSANGATTRQIAAWLAERGVKVDHTTVGRALRRIRSERSDDTKAIVRERLSRTLTSDLDRLDEIRREVAARRKGIDPGDAAGFAKLCDLEVKVIDTKLHYAGADQPDTNEPQSDADADDKLARRLAGLMAGGPAAGPPVEPDERGATTH